MTLIYHIKLENVMLGIVEVITCCLVMVWLKWWEGYYE